MNRLAMPTGYIAADQRSITCANQDVVYGSGFLGLDKESSRFGPWMIAPRAARPPGWRLPGYREDNSDCPF